MIKVIIFDEDEVLIQGKRRFSVTLAEKHGISGFGYVSNSGGALIAFISGEKLLGLEALERDTEKL